MFFQEENVFVMPAYLSSRLSSLDGDDGDERADDGLSFPPPSGNLLMHPLG